MNFVLLSRIFYITDYETYAVASLSHTITLILHE